MNTPNTIDHCGHNINLEHSIDGVEHASAVHSFDVVIFVVYHFLKIIYYWSIIYKLKFILDDI